jgi:hypothetical protein
VTPPQTLDPQDDVGTGVSVRVQGGCVATVAPATSYIYSVDAAGLIGAESPAAQITTPVAARTATWCFWSLDSDPGAGSKADTFNDASWPPGVGEFGLGDWDVTNYIPPAAWRPFFQTSFTVADASALSSATLRFLVDDGAVSTLNGTEVGRFTMPSGSVTYTSPASTSLGVPAQMTYQSMAIPLPAGRNGRSQLAVSVH